MSKRKDVRWCESRQVSAAVKKAVRLRLKGFLDTERDTGHALALGKASRAGRHKGTSHSRKMRALQPAAAQ